MKVGLLISTYNWPESLNLVLKSALLQTRLPDEILIADDGSNQTTIILIEEYQKKYDIPIKHFWQEDKGFRKSKILNKAIAGATADYIIQVDGDCILHPKFIEDHVNAAEKGLYLYGSRVNILPNAIEEVFAKNIITFSVFSKEIKNKTRAIHIPFLSQLYKSHFGISKKFRGCNVSFWRKDFIAINGYNEDYEGWGREDSDLVIRMGNNGIKAKRLRYAGIVYHIHHKTSSKDNFELNDKRQNETILKKTVWIMNGVDQYLK
ncbi:glycosyltransferase family 2 protein [Flavobacterium psychrotolerans]|uniref:Glycosyl transferase n=1 Tax=Flavobacterium psychrotolerans TaxID=2169410 RepID=A0A2U1JLU4_9FLAO|nr:glycosyltransferase family 2 protein [Flavobacterium psychrotolerans]PWA06137.1 glycosyl transferase [Flavobacterium psychrotolerans]